MKRNNIFKIALLALSFFALSCDNSDDNLKSYSGNKEAYLFNLPASNLPVGNTGDSFVDIEVGVTTKSTVDRAITLSVDAASTATSVQYTIDAASLVIPANEYVGKVRIYGNYANLVDNVTSTLVLNLDADDIIPGKDSHTVSLFRFCPTDLAGSYSVTTNYSFHDFLPSYASNTLTVNVTETGTNTYRVDDFSGGLYSTGPYATNYGTGTAGQAGNRDLVFAVNCGNISWTGQTDPWGAIVADGPCTYDPVTGVITIAWTCVRYGETGVSVYTPN